MNRNLTPRPVKATGARDAHGSILDPTSGSLYVHMHRESGLAHRHYVLKAWQVRALRVLLSVPMRALYVMGIVMWWWMATQAVRVPVLQQRIGVLTREAGRLDTLTIRLTELQDRYDQVQRMLGAAQAATGKDTARAGLSRVAPSGRPVLRDSTRGAARDTALDTTRAKVVPPGR